MNTLIVLECERYIQPFMRAMLTVAQKHYDNVIIITNPLSKGNTIEGDNLKHIEVSNAIRRKSILFSPIWLMSSDVITQSIKVVSGKRFKKNYIRDLKLYSCYGMAFYWAAQPYVKKYLKEGDVHVLSCWFAMDAWAVGRLKKYYPKIKAYSLAHSFEIDPLKNDFVDLTFNEWKHKYLDKIFFISEKMREIYNKETKYRYIQKYKEQMAVSYLGCIKLFDEMNPYMQKEKLRIVSCSYVRPEKRIDLIMSVISKWTKCPIEWIHFGNGPLLDEMKERSMLIMKENPKVSIDFRGYLSNDDVQKLYTNEHFDFFINLSSSEGIPVSIMEAIAYGIPVVATDVGGVSEIIDDKHGLLITSDATEETIRRDLESFVAEYQSDAEKMRNAANGFWKTKFNAISNYNNFFKSLNLQ